MIDKQYENKINNETDEAQIELLKINRADKINNIDTKLYAIPRMSLFKYLKYYLSKEIKRLEHEREEEIEENENQFKKIKERKNKKIRGKIKFENNNVNDEEDSNEEARTEIEKTINPILELKKIIQETKKEISYNFKF